MRVLRHGGTNAQAQHCSSAPLCPCVVSGFVLCLGLCCVCPCVVSGSCVVSGFVLCLGLCCVSVCNCATAHGPLPPLQWTATTLFESSLRNELASSQKRSIRLWTKSATATVVPSRQCEVACASLPAPSSSSSSPLPLHIPSTYKHNWHITS